MDHIKAQIGYGLSDRLDRVLDQALADSRVVGAVILVSQRGRLVYHRAAGLADREAGRAMDEQAIFRLASITKPLVTAAAMRLVEQGAIDLVSPITRWLPEFRPTLPHGNAPDISVHNLLTHTAGLSYRFLEQPHHPYHLLDVSDGLDQPGLTLEENLARLARAPLAFKPGAAWRYSLATDVLGAVMSAATAAPLDELVRELVTGPLNMADTAFYVVDRSRLAAAYADSADKPVRMSDAMRVPLFDSVCAFAPGRILDPNSYPSGGAGMAGTAHDILTFLETIRTGGDPILGSASVEAMLADQVGVEAATQGPGWGFGYGWAVLVDSEAASSPQAKGTVQWGGAYGHYWFIDPVNELTVVQLTNTAFEGMAGAFPGDIRNAVYA